MLNILTGKTHTISGTYDKPGIFIKLAKYLFGQLNSRNMGDNSVSMVFLSYIELYNNSLYDLLNSNSGVDGESTVRLHEHPTQGIIVTGSKSLRTPVHSAEEALELVAKGNKLRAVSSTQLNERSSRSHTIITFDVVTRAIDDDGIESERSSRINLVDLAGSERLKMSGADGKVLEETKHINKALSSLGDVLNSLSKHYLDNQDGHGRPAGHIPYRDSKLTMLLKSSLGGNTKTIMLATVRNSSAFYHQSLTTLRYAARARHIKNIPIRNVSHVSPSVHSSLDEGSAHDMMQTKLLEIMELRKQLQSRNNECSQLRQQLDIVSNKSFGSPKGSADESALQMKYEQMLRDLEARKNEEEAELKKRLKYVIMKKSELYESSLDTKDRKLQELSRIVEVTQIQKEKADLTNKELHRKIREGQHEIVELRARNEELLMKSNTLTAKFESLQSGNVDADALVKGKDKYKQLSKDLQALGRRQHETIASYEAKMNTLRHTIAALVGTTMLDISIDQDLTFDENIDSIVSLARSAIAPTRSPSKVSTYSADSASLSPPSRQDSSIRSELDRLRHVVEESSLHLSSLKSEHELEIFRIQNDYVESSASMKNEVSQLQKQLDESVQHQSDLKMSYERKIIEIQKKCMSDVQRYEEQIHLLKSDITHYKSQVFEMRNVVVDSGRLGENNTELRGTIQRLTTDLHASESLVRQLQADIHRLESTVDEEKRERQVEVSRLTQENNQKLSEMSDRMKISTNEIKRLKENIQSSDKALENLADQNRREISRLVEEHDITLANLKTAHQSALKSLLDNGEKATGAMNVVISEKEKQIQDLKGVVLALESNIQKSESDWNKSIEELRTKMAEFESERQNALELIGKLKFANDSLRSQLKEVNRDFTEYKANAESTISQLHDGSKNASKLFEEAKLKLQNSWEQMHAEVISQYEAQISQLKSGADAERESSDARYNQKLQEITVLEDRIHQLEEHISKVKADHLVEMDASISKGNDEVSKLRGINTRQASELLDLQSLVDKLQKVNCHMQADLKSQVEKVESQTVIIEDNNNRIKDLETEVQELCKFKDGHEIHVKALLSNTSLAESKNIELIEHYEAEVQKVRAECIALLKRGVGDLGDDGEEVDPGKLAGSFLYHLNTDLYIYILYALIKCISNLQTKFWITATSSS